MRNFNNDFDSGFSKNINSGFKFVAIVWAISAVFGLGLTGAIIYAIVAATQKFLM